MNLENLEEMDYSKLSSPDAISKCQAVIGWTLGSRISSFRWNLEARPVCTIELSPAVKAKAHPVDQPLGLWGI